MTERSSAIPESRGSADAEEDLSLLRAYEPVVRFTAGEFFFPVSVERYVANAALWREPAVDAPALKAAAGTLDLASLASMTAETQGLGESLSGVIAGTTTGRAKILATDRPPRLRGGSRLAAVGLLARLIDAVNRVSLLFRGSVPGGSAARSFLLQQERLVPEEPTYYGRVIRDNEWIICQYWFFYAFNNWRSAFGGVNEHEADWEQVTVYLDGTEEVDSEGLPSPRWVVFSAHDETGDDLRRRWDDPDLTVVDGRHPMVYAGAGSHSGAYLPGDYLITVPSPTLGGLVVAIRRIARLLFPWSRSVHDGLAIPYVDYARGDGRRIGPGENDAWHPVVIDAATGWVRDFRGLWGHDTRDRLGGERGPAGPRYERDGTVRQSWADPVGWAGLAKVSPNPAAQCADISARIEQADKRLDEVQAEIGAARRSLRLAAAGLPPEAPEVRDLAGEERRVLGLTMEATRLRDERARMAYSITTPHNPGPPHAHLRHRRLPLEPVHGARNRLLASWAIISTPVILLAASAIATPSGPVSATNVALVWLVILVSLEGLLRGKLLSVLLRLCVATAVVVGLYYLVADWRVVLHWTRQALGWGCSARPCCSSW